MQNASSFERVNSVVRVYFSLPFQGALQKGLVAGDFTIELWDPTDTDVSGSIAVSITELGGAGISGRYYAEYTNDAEEEWTLVIKHATYAPLGISSDALVYSVQHGASNDPSAVLDFQVELGGAGVTGLVTGDFTFELWNPSGSDMSPYIATTITELGGGRYRAKFDASSEEGDWLLAVKHATYFPTGLTGVWRYVSVVSAGKSSISAAVNDDTGTSGTLTLVADDAADELFVYYRTVASGLWTLFGSTRTGSGDLQITGLTNNTLYEFIDIASRSGSPLLNPSPPSEPARIYITDGATVLTSIWQALYDWVDNEVPIDVVWAPANAPEAGRTFVAIRAGPLATIMEDSHSGPDDAGVDTITGDREFTFTAEVLGPNAPEHTGGGAPSPKPMTFDYAESISTSLQKRSVLDTLGAAGIAFVEVLPVQDLSAIGSIDFQVRALVEVRFRIASEVTDDLNWIDTAENPQGTYGI